jgi:hypothetical protein
VEGSGHVAPRILNLGSRWRWVVISTPLPLFPRYPLDVRLGWPQSRFLRGVEEKITSPAGYRAVVVQPVLWLLCRLSCPSSLNVKVKSLACNTGLNGDSWRTVRHIDWSRKFLIKLSSESSSVSVETMLRAEWPVFDSRRGQWWHFFFATASSPVLGPTQPPIQWVPRINRLGHEDDHSLPSSAKVKNAWSYTSQYMPMASFIINQEKHLQGVVLCQAQGQLYLFYLYFYIIMLY